MAAKKSTNGHNGHVSLAREEYDALMSREEQFSVLTAENAKLQTQRLEIAQTVDAQAKHLSGFELKTMHLERINALQKVIVDMLNDKGKVASLEDLSEFWRQWIIHTSNAVDAKKLTREDVLKFEPELFKTWRNWVNDSGKPDRTLNFGGSRTERDASQPRTQVELQEHTIRRQREENYKLANRVLQLESEIEALKAGTKQP